VKLYSYFRSSAAYRVRIALNFKNIAYDMVPIHLQKDGGRHKSAEYRTVNPQMRVPALELPGGEVLVQSLAIINYLEETFPEPALLPPDARSRGWYHHWILEGFAAIEALIKPGPFAFGPAVTLADVCLVPQVANAKRFKVPLDVFPKIVAAEEACQQLPAFEKARAENQPDAE